MIKEIFCPIKTIEKEKKNKSMTNQFLTLAIASLIFAISTVVLSLTTGVPENLFLVAAIYALIYFVIAPIGAFIYSFLTKTIANKGKYKDSFTAVTQTALILATGLLITSLAVLIPQLGFIIGLVVMFFTIIYALAIFIRAMTTLTGADTIQVLTILIIMLVGLVVATQTLLAIQIVSDPSAFIGAQEMPTNFAL